MGGTMSSGEVESAAPVAWLLEQSCQIAVVVSKAGVARIYG